MSLLAATLPKTYFSICFLRSWLFGHRSSILCWIPIVFLLPVLDIALVPKDLSLIYQWIHLFFLIDQPVYFLIAVGRHWWRWGEKVKCEASVHTAACPPSSHQSGTSCLWEWMFSHANPTLDKHLTQPDCVRCPAEMRYTLELGASCSTPSRDDRNFQPMARIPLTTPSSLPVW